MSRSRGHGKRRHRADCDCGAKSACFTTMKAALSAVATVPDAERAYRGDCCGHYHITRYTQDEYAQRVAAFTEGADHEDRAPGTEPGSDARGPRAPALQRGDETRPTPTPAEVARVLQARGRTGPGRGDVDAGGFPQSTGLRT